jgi:hypothetical protein
VSSRKRASRIAALVDKAIGRGLQRSRMLGEHALTQAYSQASLDAMEARGVTHVGTVTERRSGMPGMTPTSRGVRLASGQRVGESLNLGLEASMDEKLQRLPGPGEPGWEWPSDVRIRKEREEGPLLETLNRAQFADFNGGQP